MGDPTDKNPNAPSAPAPEAKTDGKMPWIQWIVAGIGALVGAFLIPGGGLLAGLLGAVAGFFGGGIIQSNVNKTIENQAASAASGAGAPGAKGPGQGLSANTPGQNVTPGDQEAIKNSEAAGVIKNVVTGVTQGTDIGRNNPSEPNDPAQNLKARSSAAPTLALVGGGAVVFSRIVGKPLNAGLNATVNRPLGRFTGRQINLKGGLLPWVSKTPERLAEEAHKTLEEYKARTKDSGAPPNEKEIEIFARATRNEKINAALEGNQSSRKTQNLANAAEMEALVDNHEATHPGFLRRLFTADVEVTRANIDLKLAGATTNTTKAGNLADTLEYFATSGTPEQQQFAQDFMNGDPAVVAKVKAVAKDYDLSVQRGPQDPYLTDELMKGYQPRQGVIDNAREFVAETRAARQESFVTGYVEKVGDVISNLRDRAEAFKRGEITMEEAKTFTPKEMAVLRNALRNDAVLARLEHTYGPHAVEGIRAITENGITSPTAWQNLQSSFSQMFGRSRNRTNGSGSNQQSGNASNAKGTGRDAGGTGAPQNSQTGNQTSGNAPSGDHIPDGGEPIRAGEPRPAGFDPKADPHGIFQRLTPVQDPTMTPAGAPVDGGHHGAAGSATPSTPPTPGSGNGAPQNSLQPDTQTGGGVGTLTRPMSPSATGGDPVHVTTPADPVHVPPGGSTGGGLVPVDPNLPAVAPKVPAPGAGFAAAAKNAHGYAGVAMGTYSLYESIQRHDAVGGTLATANIGTGGGSIAVNALENAGKTVAPGLVKGLGKANVFLMVADGVWQVSQEDSLAHGGQRAAAVLTTGAAAWGAGALTTAAVTTEVAAGGALATVAGVGVGAVALAAAPIVIATGVAVGAAYLGNEAINTSRIYEEVDKTFTVDTKMHKNLIGAEARVLGDKNMRAELAQLGVPAEANGYISSNALNMAMIDPLKGSAISDKLKELIGRKKAETDKIMKDNEPAWYAVNWLDSSESRSKYEAAKMDSRSFDSALTEMDSFKEKLTTNVQELAAKKQAIAKGNLDTFNKLDVGTQQLITDNLERNYAQYKMGRGSAALSYDDYMLEGKMSVANDPTKLTAFRETDKQLSQLADAMTAKLKLEHPEVTAQDIARDREPLMQQLRAIAMANPAQIQEMQKKFPASTDPNQLAYASFRSNVSGDGQEVKTAMAPQMPLQNKLHKQHHNNPLIKPSSGPAQG